MILLVQDDLVTCHIMTALLTRRRLAHVVARTAAEALAHLAGTPIDLIVTDVTLPDAHGLDLVEDILARPHLRDIPVMVCTADASARTVERALALGVVDFVKQPLDVDALADRVDRALRRAPLRWEPWREVVRRLRVDSHAYYRLVALARDALGDVVRTLADIVEGRATLTELRAAALAASLVRVRGAALNVGAIRTVQLLDLFWSGPVTARVVADLHDALALEYAVVGRALQHRSAAA
jgi:CheY-like chemotaxis protein